MRKCNPIVSKAAEWSDIEKYYSKLISKEKWDIQPMLELVQYIIETELSKRLYGSISMARLRISIYDEIDYRRETLHIEYNQDSESWIFEYYSKPFKPTEFFRRYNKSLGIKKFQNIINYLNW